MTQKFKIQFEGLHGHLVSYGAALGELRAYLLPGRLALWESDSQGDILSLLSPALVDRYRKLLRQEGP